LFDILDFARDIANFEICTRSETAAGPIRDTRKPRSLNFWPVMNYHVTNFQLVSM